MPKTVAVVGGGIFGVSCALKLAESQASVTLFERLPALMSAATGSNQNRLHRGYHYPRSKSTAAECLNSHTSFLSYYGEAVIDDFEHYYCISARDSLTTSKEFITFCDEMDLAYKPSQLDIIRAESIDLCVRVKESLIDIDRLRAICGQKLMERGVNVLTEVEVDLSLLSNFDDIVIATYAGLDSVLGDSEYSSPKYQFELCEKPVVRLPTEFRRRSVVVLDGPFMCFDPLGNSGYSIMGNVTHAIHATNIGSEPKYPAMYDQIINRGLIANPSMSKFDEFIESAKEYFPGITDASYIGSMFSVRAVLPYREKTDERLTSVSRIDDRIVSVFAGKMGTSIEAAEQICELILD